MKGVKRNINRSEVLEGFGFVEIRRWKPNRREPMIHQSGTKLFALGEGNVVRRHNIYRIGIQNNEFVFLLQE